VASTNPHNPGLLKFTTPTPLPKTSISPFVTSSTSSANTHAQHGNPIVSCPENPPNETWTTLLGNRQTGKGRHSSNGIPVTASQSSKTDTACLCLAADVSEFLLEVMGKGGILEGWLGRFHSQRRND